MTFKRKTSDKDASTKPRASFNPRHFVYSPDVLEALTGDLTPYTGTDNFTIYNLPIYTRASLERLSLQSKLSMNLETPRHTKPGMGVTTTLVISHGYSALSTHPLIKDSVALRESIAISDDTPGFDEIYAWASTFPLTIADVSATASRKFNFHTTPITKSQCGSLASDLGISSSSVALLSIFFALATQPPDAVLPSHRDFMQESVNLFLARLEIRLRMGRALLDTLNEWRQERQHV